MSQTDSGKGHPTSIPLDVGTHRLPPATTSFEISEGWAFHPQDQHGARHTVGAQYTLSANATLLLPIPFFLCIKFLSPFLSLPMSQTWDAPSTADSD